MKLKKNLPHEQNSDYLSLITGRKSPFVSNGIRLTANQVSVFSSFRNSQISTFLERTPTARKVIDLLKTKQGHIINDHIAIRTLTNNDDYSGKSCVEPLFLLNGYKKEENIFIPSLFLNCNWYEPPQQTNWPKIFISEQDVTHLPEKSREIALLAINDRLYSDLPLLHSSKNEKQISSLLKTSPFSILSSEFKTIKAESQSLKSLHDAVHYTIWTLINGFHWNHFTVLVNELNINSIPSLEDLHVLLKNNNIPLNSFGTKEVQGSAEKKLKQSSTVADTLLHTFKDSISTHTPGSFIEFIERFNYDDGNPMRGFLAGNARGIFTSTNNHL